MEADFEKALEEAVAARAHERVSQSRQQFESTVKSVLTHSLMRFASLDYDAWSVTIGGVALLYTEYSAVAPYLVLADEQGERTPECVTCVEDLHAVIAERRKANTAWPLPPAYEDDEVDLYTSREDVTRQVLDGAAALDEALDHVLARRVTADDDARCAPLRQMVVEKLGEDVLPFCTFDAKAFTVTIGGVVLGYGQEFRKTETLVPRLVVVGSDNMTLSSAAQLKQLIEERSASA